MLFNPNDHPQPVGKHRLVSFFIVIVLFVLANACEFQAQTPARRLTIAVLDLGETTFARQTAEKFSTNLKLDNTVEIPDRDQARAAARGAGYAGSLNLSLDEARNLGRCANVAPLSFCRASLFRSLRVHFFGKRSHWPACKLGTPEFPGCDSRGCRKLSVE
jgi:hypothetical protein